MNEVSIRNFTRRKTPRLPFEDVLKNTIPDWEMSLVFVGAQRATTLNKKLRRRAYTPNVLSYESGYKSGEIIICITQAEKEAHTYGLSVRNFILLLFIHGCLHLKGYPHGTTMERREQNLLSQLTKRGVHSHIYDSTHSNRNRHRNVPS